jgi:hypothetical protein
LQLPRNGKIAKNVRKNREITQSSFTLPSKKNKRSLDDIPLTSSGIFPPVALPVPAKLPELAHFLKQTTLSNPCSFRNSSILKVEKMLPTYYVTSFRQQLAE